MVFSELNCFAVLHEEQRNLPLSITTVTPLTVLGMLTYQRGCTK